MGLLTGKYSAAARLPANDVRSAQPGPLPPADMAEIARLLGAAADDRSTP